jgi:hypothetical protein
VRARGGFSWLLDLIFYVGLNDESYNALRKCIAPLLKILLWVARTIEPGFVIVCQKKTTQKKHVDSV